MIKYKCGNGGGYLVIGDNLAELLADVALLLGKVHEALAKNYGMSTADDFYSKIIQAMVDPASPLLEFRQKVKEELSQSGGDANG